MQAEVVVLRLIHVLGGIFWVGSGLFTTFFLLPVLAQSGPAAGQVMAGLQKRGLFTALPISALLTMGSGFRLMWLTSGGFSSSYLATGSGRTYVVSAVLAVTAFLLALTVARPAAVRAGRLAPALAAAPTESERERLSAEVAALRRRAGVVGTFVMGLLLVAAAGMAVARYF